ncbi:trigger factor [Actinomyces sp. oral taxon 181]|uniref:trigger factor n=1 Tax=Actinomyces sp. oral taxon 181 TaxID=712121 RepID=UPI001CAFA226|nr:trigger factor [Actinomyces sp. oral taxon 181]MBF0962764.1 trigger factor [Actinomyces sp.]MBS4797184.1 trigger factor [Actinomyces sp. oral taxon 181]MDU5759797.1 trigger factor [Actinomyces sp.]
MKSTVETLEPTKVRLTVEIPVEELKSEMDKAYKSIANQVSIPGFRKGHVPARIIDQRFGRAAVIEQVVNEVLPGQYSAAVSENELRPMSQPEVEVTEIPSTTGELTGQLVFTAQVDVVPAFDIPEYGKDTVIEVDPVEVTDEDVQEELDALRGRFASLKTIKRQAKTGDFATIDLVATINGEEVDSVSDVSYEIGSGTMLDGQDTALRKTHAGDVVTFTSTLKGGEHEGEEAEVTLTVKSVKERELPEADDDFAQMVSEFDTIDELKEDLKKQAAQTKQSQQALQARDRLVENLLSRTEILLPESVIEHELSHRVAEDASAKAKKEAREAIEKEYRTEILAEELAKKNEVQVGQQELFDYAIQMSQTYGMDINRLFSDPQQISAVVADLGRAKALIEVLSEVTVKDTAGNDVDLSEFLGKSDEEAAAEAAAETVAEVEEAAAEIADEK